MQKFVLISLLAVSPISVMLAKDFDKKISPCKFMPKTFEEFKNHSTNPESIAPSNYPETGVIPGWTCTNHVYSECAFLPTTWQDYWEYQEYIEQQRATNIASMKAAAPLIIGGMVIVAAVWLYDYFYSQKTQTGDNSLDQTN